MVSDSWHVSSLPFYNIPPPNEALHVVFLQRLSSEVRTQILQSLEDVDVEWATPVDPNVRPRQLLATPWIRDHWPSSAAVLAMLVQGIKTNHSHPNEYLSYILIDSGWEAASVIAARWEIDSTGERRVVAARVPMSDANVLLAMCDRGSVPSLIDAIGEEQYKESKVDFYDDADVSKKLSAVPAAPEYQPPNFLPADLALSTTQLIIVSLLPLSDDESAAILEEINRDIDDKKGSEDAKFYDWEGATTPSRQDILHLYQWMKRNSSEECQSMCAFFLDNITQDEEEQPRILAVKDYYTRPQAQVTNCDVQLVPLITENVWSAWRAATENANLDDIADDHCPWARERVVDMTKPLEWELACCSVFYLQPFTIAEERTIRKVLQASENDAADVGITLCYFGYLWPSGTEKHTMQDLRDLFEKVEPRSAAFDPLYSKIRMSTYPNEIVALDDRASLIYVLFPRKLVLTSGVLHDTHPTRILKPNKPQVMMGSGLDFHISESSDSPGWIIGQLDASEVLIAYCNLDIANMGPDELLSDTEKLWLNDLSDYREHDYDSDE